MRNALKLRRKPASSKPVPAEDVALTDQYRAALKGQFTQGSNVQVLVRNEKGSSVLDFKSIPVGEVGTLLLALMDHVPPGNQFCRRRRLCRGGLGETDKLWRVVRSCGFTRPERRGVVRKTGSTSLVEVVEQPGREAAVCKIEAVVPKRGQAKANTAGASL